MGRVLVVLALLAGASAQPASACSCMLTTIEQRFQSSSVVFIGKVQSIALDLSSPDKPFEDVTFLVQKAWKGVKAGQHLRFHTMVACCMCGVSIQSEASRDDRGPLKPPGTPIDYHRPLPKIFQAWMVFADGREPYELNLCSNSQPFESEFGNSDTRWLNSHARAR